MSTYIAKGVVHLRKSDLAMARLIREYPRPAFKRSRNYYRSLVRAIVFQQLHGRAASTIYGRFKALYASPFPRPEEVRTTSIARLRSVGLSAAKAKYVRAVSEAFASGAIRSRDLGAASDEGVAELLLPIKGIGQWSVDMFLIFALGRPDVLPLGDYAVRKGMRIHFGLGEEASDEKLRRLAGPWKPYRSIASWYMWRLTDAT